MVSGAILAAIIIPSLVIIAWMIYMIIYIVKKCHRFQQDDIRINDALRELREQSELLEQNFDILEQNVQIKTDARLDVINLDMSNIQLDKGWMTEPFYNTIEQDCVICMTELKENCIMTKCYHKFHFNCIKTWENVTHQKDLRFLCPSCKQELYQDLI